MIPQGYELWLSQPAEDGADREVGRVIGWEQDGREYIPVIAVTLPDGSLLGVQKASSDPDGWVLGSSREEVTEV
ncbi:hypothetical protein AB0875_07145 [Micromonospora gifhornensis]|uniref:hypothetical protein n=1 Tax=Micromonospora gifhornensis TaxID=84594 RepID=UPI00345551A3